MAQRSAKLVRQLDKYLGVADAEPKLIGLGGALNPPPEGHADAVQALGHLAEFLDAVDGAYHKYEDNLLLANRNVSISSRELNNLNLSMRTLLDGLGEGFLIFGADGICRPTFSKACLVLLEGVPSGRHITEVLRLEGDALDHFKLWLDMVFSRDHAVPLDDLIGMAPKEYVHTAELAIKLAYRPILNPEGTPEAFVMIASDHTAERTAEAKVAHERAFMESLLPVARDRDTFRTFLRQFREVLAYAGQSHVEPAVMKREVHTLKGMAGMFHMNDLVEALHDAESSIGGALMNAEERVALLKPVEVEISAFLARFKEVLGESVEHTSAMRHVPVDQLEEFGKLLVRLKMPPDIIRAFRETLQSVPVNICLANVDNYVQALATRLNKSILPVVYEGTNPPVIEPLYAGFFSSLIHVWRNMLDHGIESPGIREGAGKLAEGKIVIRTEIERDGSGKEWLCFTFIDDGAGIDPARIRDKLATLDPDGDWKKFDDAAILQEIFRPGFSTAKQITHYSGRGVGMDAVMAEVTNRGGRAEVRSVIGQGTTFVFYLPYVWE